MKNTCNCQSEQTNQPELFTVRGGQFEQLAALSSKRLFAASNKASAAAKANASALAGGGGLETHFHMTAQGDALSTTSFAEGSEGDIVVRGIIAGIPYELHIKVALDGNQVAVTLHLTKPIEIGPYTWRFDLGGVVKNNGQIVGASSIAPAADFQALGINWWCAVKCGGARILPTLVLCLPALAGGPAAYVACVVGKLGSGDAAAIALCIAKKCH